MSEYKGEGGKFSQLSLEDFLPAYSLINMSKDDPLFAFYADKIPEHIDKEFYPSIFLKREFNELKLTPYELLPAKGSPMRHQAFVSRFISQKTPYNKLLVFHAMGTGKSMLTGFTAELAKAMNPNLLETLILVRGPTLRENFANEIASINDKYMPPLRDSKTGLPLSEDTRKRRMFGLLGANYDIQTFQKFATEIAASLANNDIKYIKDVYSNRLIVIDEAHNLRIQPKDTKISIYRTIFDFLHIVENCKIMLLTATPMRDRPDEIASLLNLLLPDDPRYQISKETFMHDYFDNDVFKDDKKQEFKQLYLRGLISYVRGMASDVNKEYMGKIVDPMKKIPIVTVQMSDLQQEAYIEAWNKDRRIEKDVSEINEDNEEDLEASADVTEESNVEEVLTKQKSPPKIPKIPKLKPKIPKLSKKKKSREKVEKISLEEEGEEGEEEGKESEGEGVYRNSRQAAMLVFPDGTFYVPPRGKKGKKKTEEKITNISRWMVDDGRGIAELTDEFKDYLTNGDSNASNEVKLENLRRLSVKFAGAIEQILLNPKEKVFIYINIVQGAGALLFGAILRFFDFIHVSVPTREERLREREERLIRKYHFTVGGDEDHIIRVVKRQEDIWFVEEDLDFLGISDLPITEENHSFLKKIIPQSLRPELSLLKVINEKGLHAYKEIEEKISPIYDEFYAWIHSVVIPGMKKQAEFNLEKYRNPNQYVVVTGKSLTPHQANILINKVWNDPANLYGDYIRVVIGSKVIGEGTSFKHTRQCHVLTPGWNNTETEQAIGRVLRAFAHNVFTDPREKYLKIYRWCCLLTANDTPSIDFLMYALSEDKDLKIKQVERLLKESAVDCALNVERNILRDLADPNDPSNPRNIDKDDTRECDYMTCVYHCDDIPLLWYTNPDLANNLHLINDTYNLYFAREEIENMKNTIIRLFQHKFMYDFIELLELLPETSPFVLVRSLKELIDYSIPITNRYGMISYLREDKNFYFLVDSQLYANSYLLAYYNANPVLQDTMKFVEYVRYAEYEFIGDKLDKLASIVVDKEKLTPDIKNQVINNILSFDVYVQEMLLESFYIAEQENIEKNRNLREIFLSFYHNYIKNIENPTGTTPVSILLFDDTDTLRCYNSEEAVWEDCGEEMFDAYRDLKSARKVSLRENPFGYFAIINTKIAVAKAKGKKKQAPQDLKIATVRKNVRISASKGTPDRRIDKQQGEGTVCGTGKTFSAGKLIPFMYMLGEKAEELGIPPPELTELTPSQKTELETVEPEDLIESNKFNATNKKFVSEEELKELQAEVKHKGKEMKTIEKGKRKREKVEVTEPFYTEEQIREFSTEKARRLYAIAVFGNGDKLCKSLKMWFIERELYDMV